MTDTADRGGSVGILGAGKVGTVLARLAVGGRLRRADRRLGRPGEDRAHRRGARAWRRARHRRGTRRSRRTWWSSRCLSASTGTIPADALAGKLVIDAMNYWWEVDGLRDDFTDPGTSTSEIVQAFLSGSPRRQGVQPHGLPRPRGRGPTRGAPGRKAIAIAGDDPADLAAVAGIVDSLGFDPVIAGSLSDGIRMEPGAELFGADVPAAEVQAMLDRFPCSDARKSRRGRQGEAPQWRGCHQPPRCRTRRDHRSRPRRGPARAGDVPGPHLTVHQPRDRSRRVTPR